jgi:hypothetical protein
MEPFIRKSWNFADKQRSLSWCSSFEDSGHRVFYTTMITLKWYFLTFCGLAITVQFTQLFKLCINMNTRIHTNKLHQLEAHAPSLITCAKVIVGRTTLQRTIKPFSQVDLIIPCSVPQHCRRVMLWQWKHSSTCWSCNRQYTQDLSLKTMPSQGTSYDNSAEWVTGYVGLGNGIGFQNVGPSW